MRKFPYMAHPPSPQDQTLVLIIDDHPFVLRGCSTLLEEGRPARTLAANGFAEGYRLYRARRPHVIIVDLSIRTSPLGGLSFVRRLRLHDKKTPILVLSMHNDPMIVRRALDVGATGYILKDAPGDEFLRAFDNVRAGKRYISHDMACDLTFNEVRSEASPLSVLTDRELQTLALIAEGKSYNLISDELGISYKTVANTTSLIKTKLGARNLPELMRIAIQHLPSSTRRTRLG